MIHILVLMRQILCHWRALSSVLASALIHADLEGLPEDLRQMLRRDGLEVVDHPLVLDYAYWPADHILQVRRRLACSALPRFGSVTLCNQDVQQQLLVVEACITPCRGCCPRGRTCPAHSRRSATSRTLTSVMS